MPVEEYVRILNVSKQMIPIQARAPKSDFYTNEIQVRLAPGKDAKLPKSHLMMEQIDNLCKRGLLRVVYDSTNET